LNSAYPQLVSFRDARKANNADEQYLLRLLAGLFLTAMSKKPNKYAVCPAYAAPAHEIGVPPALTPGNPQNYRFSEKPACPYFSYQP
jgi:hypothetical protein